MRFKFTKTEADSNKKMITFRLRHILYDLL